MKPMRLTNWLNEQLIMIKIKQPCCEKESIDENMLNMMRKNNTSPSKQLLSS